MDNQRHAERGLSQHNSTVKKDSVPISVDICLVLIICAAFAAVFVNLMNIKSQIAVIDNEIAKTISAIEKNKPYIKNQRNRLENLKGGAVICSFATKNKMVFPQHGQVCVVNESDIIQRPQRVVSNYNNKVFDIGTGDSLTAKK